MEVSDRFHFGPFCLDARERVLLRDRRLVPLAPKALSTLLVLVRNTGHLVEKDVLMAAVWPDEIVEEGNLAQQIFTLRKALGESTQYIETVPRRGYRFLDAVEVTRLPSTRYTDNAEVQKAYLRGRYCWSKHTREGLERAIGYFQQAINLRADYVPAYSAMVDCYLRLATNYFPPPESLATTESSALPVDIDETLPEVQAATEIVCKWDKETAESEHRRAAELQFNDPAVHQWHAAYLFARSLYTRGLMKTDQGLGSVIELPRSLVSDVRIPNQLQKTPTTTEHVQVACSIARAQINLGNYDGARAVMQPWWTMGQWPKLAGLGPHSSADLLYTSGVLASSVSSTRQVPRGQKHAEALLSGAIAIFEQLGCKTLSAQARIKIGICYYNEGMFDLAHTTVRTTLEELPEKDRLLRGLCLIGLATFERHAGHLHNAFAYLKEIEITEIGTRAAGCYHVELATTLGEAGKEGAVEHFEKARHKFEGIGNHRYAAVVYNNYGYLLMRLGRLEEAETQLMRACKMFEYIADPKRRPAFDDTLAQLYLAQNRFELAEQAISRSVHSLETAGHEADLAESLTTQGRILCRLGRRREAKRVLERAFAVAERCGDQEGAACALLTKVEEMCEHLDNEERMELGSQLDQLLAHAQKPATLDRLRKCHQLIASSHAYLGAD
jgi:DNA-binding winged helix-turn-helix (wHTH) protein/Tfp pilus assembly protein PilF